MWAHLTYKEILRTGWERRCFWLLVLVVSLLLWLLITLLLLCFFQPISYTCIYIYIYIYVYIHLFVYYYYYYYGRPSGKMLGALLSRAPTNSNNSNNSNKSNNSNHSSNSSNSNNSSNNSNSNSNSNKNSNIPTSWPPTFSSIPWPPTFFFPGDTPFRCNTQRTMKRDGTFPSLLKEGLWMQYSAEKSLIHVKGTFDWRKSAKGIAYLIIPH